MYAYFYDVWGVQIFDNISRSEESHTEAIRTLIERYGLEDPLLSTTVGEYVNPDLQDLYDQLTAQGNNSLKDALLVGAAIEEIDILDIQAYLDQTVHEDIILVYKNLMKGSENHLKAFVQNLSNQTGETYFPQYLSQQAFDEIIGSFSGSGSNGQRRNGRP